MKEEWEGCVQHRKPKISGQSPRQELVGEVTRSPDREEREDQTAC
jgi:hypothetical protein